MQRSALYETLEAVVTQAEEVERRILDEKMHTVKPHIDGITNKPLPPALKRLWLISDGGDRSTDLHRAQQVTHLKLSHASQPLRRCMACRRR